MYQMYQIICNENGNESSIRLKLLTGLIVLIFLEIN